MTSNDANSNATSNVVLPGTLIVVMILLISNDHDIHFKDNYFLLNHLVFRNSYTDNIGPISSVGTGLTSRFW